MSTGEETIEEILERLRGAPRIVFLEKWARRLRELLPPGADPAVVYGSPKLTADTAEKILREYCPDLTESECYKKIIEIVRHTGYKESILSDDYIDKVNKDFTLAQNLANMLKLSFPLDPGLARKIYISLLEKRLNPDEVCEDLQNAMESWYQMITQEPSDEDLRAVSEACNRLRERARRLTADDWREILEPVHRTREFILPDLRPYARKLKEYGLDKDVERHLSRITPDDVIILLGEGGIRRALPNLTVKYVEANPLDYIDPIQVKAIFGAGARIFGGGYASQASEFIYFNKIFLNGTEVPLACLYDFKNDYLLVCDRPAVLIRYTGREVRVYPIVYFKLIEGLERFGFTAGEVR